MSRFIVPPRKERHDPAAARKIKFIVSACLAGANCTHNGRNNLWEPVRMMVVDGRAVAVCPEVLGGMPIPRQRCEIDGGSGKGVLDGNARVVTRGGRDCSRQFIRGATKALAIAKAFNIKKALLKSGSPSCGVLRIHDGTFSGRLKTGRGVTSALFIRNGISVRQLNLLKKI